MPEIGPAAGKPAECATATGPPGFEQLAAQVPAEAAMVPTARFPARLRLTMSIIPAELLTTTGHPESVREVTQEGTLAVRGQSMLMIPAEASFMIARPPTVAREKIQGGIHALFDPGVGTGRHPSQSSMADGPATHRLEEQQTWPLSTSI